ncbi:hypothetical protein ACIBQX_18705 [Nonomuraea sp. NPDC049714]|uniref:hypothetical protein n=1 Tax=Nonomuraea sp. NPDC049714 TaxID=3364357 RepID=UPI0037ADC46D
MPVNEKLMELGSWSFELVDETPKTVLDQIGYFGHVAFVPGKLNPAEYGDELLDMARYVGVVMGKSVDHLRKVVSGQGMSLWLADSDGKGDLIETPIQITGQTFANAIRAILGSGTAVVEGTLHSGVAGTYTGRHVYQSRHKAINFICTTMGAEWRVNGRGELDAGLTTSLYNETPDTVIVRRRPNRHTDGDDLSLHGLRGDMGVASDVKDWTDRVVLLAEGEGNAIATASADNPDNPYLDLRGQPIHRTRVISESTTAPGNAAARAEYQLAKYVTPRSALTLTTDDYDVSGAFAVGDWAWIYNVAAGLVDTQNEITFRGERINPIRMRMVGASWPIRRGMTVAYRGQDGSWLDLTPYVVWEGGETTVTVGDLLRALSDGSVEPVGPRPIPDSTIPGVVSWSLPFESGVYLAADGTTRAKMLVKWDLPLNVDGSTILDGDHYEIGYGVSPVAVDEWQTAYAPWGDLQAMVNDLSPGVDYDFRIRAVDSSNNQGAWSATQTEQTNADTIAPSTPAPPTVAGSLIAIQITHTLGMASGGEWNLELDLHHLEVHVGATNTFTADETTLKGAVSAHAGMIAAQIPAVGTVPVAETTARWVRVIAVDEAGNRSAASAAVTATAVLIDDAHISDLTVTKVTAGTVSANWLLGASIRTANSGQRVELNQTGLHGYNSGGTELVSLLNTGSFTLRSATTGARVELDNSGFRAYNSSSQQTVDIASSTGNVTIVGQLSSAFSGRRIIFNPSGTTDPEIRFLSTIGTIATSARIMLANSDSDWTFFKIEGPTAGGSPAQLHLSHGTGVGFTRLGEDSAADSYDEGQFIGLGNSYSDRRIWFSGRIKPANDSGVPFGHSAVIPGSVDVDGTAFTIFDGYYAGDPMYAMFTPTAGNAVGHAVTSNGSSSFSGIVSVGLSGSDRVTYWNIRL